MEVGVYAVDGGDFRCGRGTENQVFRARIAAHLLRAILRREADEFNPRKRIARPRRLSAAGGRCDFRRSARVGRGKIRAAGAGRSSRVNARRSSQRARWKTGLSIIIVLFRISCFVR